jgi:hypothetical protein
VRVEAKTEFGQGRSVDRLIRPAKIQEHGWEGSWSVMAPSLPARYFSDRRTDQKGRRARCDVRSTFVGVRRAFPESGCGRTCSVHKCQVKCVYRQERGGGEVQCELHSSSDVSA